MMIETDEPATFLRTWREGDWETLRNEWPEAPKEIYPLDALAREYDAASEDAAWEEGHPIFQMAAENDQLKKKLSLARSLLHDMSRSSYSNWSNYAIREGYLRKWRRTLRDVTQ